MILADKIIELRKKSGWSQEQLASELGISRQSVSKWESGMSIPDIDKIIKMSALFGVSTDYLLKDELENETKSETSETDEQECRVVSVEEANTYMQLVEKASKIMAVAISLFVFSPIPLLLLGGLSECKNVITEDQAGGFGVGILLLLIVIGVVAVILKGMELSPYEYLEKEVFTLQYGVEGIVRKKKEEFAPRFRVSIALGVGLCISGVIPLIVAGGMGASDFVLICMTCLLLFCIATAVFFFVRVGMINESYEKLLQEGDYSVEEKLSNKKIEFFPVIYWCIVTAIYLGISLYSNAWHKSWIIWPVAGVLFVAVIGILKAVLKNKK